LLCNAYVKGAGTTEDSNGADASGGVSLSSCGNNILVHDITGDWGNTLISIGGAGGVNNLQAYNNALSHSRWGINIGVNTGCTTSTNFLVYGNDINNGYEWSQQDGFYHLDGVITNGQSCSGGVNGIVNGLYQYNNYIHGQFQMAQAIATCTESGTTATCNTPSAPFPYRVGQMFRVSSTSVSGYAINPGTILASPAPTTTSFSYTLGTSGLASSTGGLMDSGGTICPTGFSYNTGPDGTNTYIFNNTYNILAGFACNGTTAAANNHGINYFNNTILGYGSGAGVAIGSANTLSGVTVENNIVSNFQYAINFSDAGTLASVMAFADDNDYFSANTFRTSDFFSNFANWQTKTCGSNPCDAHSFQSNPMLPGSPPFVPGAGSPVIGTGANLTSICSGQPNPGLGALCFDAQGNARPASASGPCPGSAGCWTMGAFEVGGAPPPFNPRFVTGGGCETGGTSCTITLSVTAGQFVVVGGGVSSTTSETYSVSDTNGDSFTNPSRDPFVGSANSAFLAFAVIGTTNGSEVFTCSDSSSIPFFGCVVGVYTGTPTSGWDVALAGTTNAGTGGCTFSASSGTSGTTANASELGVGLFVSVGNSSNITWTGTSGWTFRVKSTATSALSVALVDEILSSTQALTASVSATNCPAVTTPTLGMVSSIK
jgi:hypothetical protein